MDDKITRLIAYTKDYIDAIDLHVEHHPPQVIRAELLLVNEIEDLENLLKDEAVKITTRYILWHTHKANIIQKVFVPIYWFNRYEKRKTDAENDYRKPI